MRVCSYCAQECLYVADIGGAYQSLLGKFNANGKYVFIDNNQTHIHIVRAR
jgi:hypothetical protein